MPRGLDHVVHAVHDLDTAAALYRSLGFRVGARNRHPPSWGTQNHIVQLPGFFVELLGIADGTQIAPHGPRFFSFGAFNHGAIKRGDGLSMLVLESEDARADAATFRAAGIGDFEPFEFEREGRRPDGTPIRVAFSLAFAHDQHAPEVGFFACQQRFPENFWNPAFQNHFNTAAAIAGAVIVADKPSDHYRFMTALTGQNEAQANARGLAFPTPRGEIEIITPVAFEQLFDETPLDTAKGARLAALRFAVRDLGAAAALLYGSDIGAREHRGRLIVGPKRAMGATLVFEPINNG